MYACRATGTRTKLYLRRRGLHLSRIWWQDALLHRMFRRVLIVVAIVIFGAAPQAQRGDAPLPLPEILVRISDRVGHWYARAQSLVSLESVSIQPLRADLSG